jgi:hypothetical protein
MATFLLFQLTAAPAGCRKAYRPVTMISKTSTARMALHKHGS